MIRFTLGSRPTLQIEAMPCGLTWKKVWPALQPVKTLRGVMWLSACVARGLASPSIVGDMFVKT